MKSKEKKTKTFVYKGFGFPITLVNAPMKKILGEWVIDIDMTRLQLTVLRTLAFKKGRLAQTELQFIRKYLSMTTTEFGKAFGVSHASVSQWENGKRHLSPSTEFCIRLHILAHLRAKAKEFQDLYNAVNLSVLAEKKSTKLTSIKVDVSEDFRVA